MATFKHINDMVFIDDLQIPISLFLVLEPSYKTPNGFEMLVYKNGVLTVRSNGITTTVSGWSQGDRYIARKNDFGVLVKLANKETRDINLEVDSISRPKECRKSEYPQTHDMIVALWEHIVEKRDFESSGINALQVKREEVKNKYPLKENADGTNKVEGSVEAVLPKGTRRTRNRSKHSG